MLLGIAWSGHLVSEPATTKGEAPTSAAPKPSFTVATDRPDGTYHWGETITFTVLMMEDARPVAGRSLSYVVQGDGDLKKEGRLLSEMEPVKVSVQMNRPGWVQLKVTGADAEGKAIPWWKLTGVAGAAVEPSQVRAGQKVPADFDAY
jgi:hypothetical protein